MESRHSLLAGRFESTPTEELSNESYVDTLVARITAKEDPKNLQPYFRRELEALMAQIKTVLLEAADGDTHDHLAFIDAEIDQTLHPINVNK